MAQGDLKTALNTLVQASKSYAARFDTHAYNNANVGVYTAKKRDVFLSSMAVESNAYSFVSAGLNSKPFMYIENSGPAQPADVATWTAIDGKGMYPVKNGTDANAKWSFTAKGTWMLDRNRYIVNTDNQYLSYLPTNPDKTIPTGSDTGTLDSLQPLCVSNYSSLGQRTTYLNMAVNLPSNAANGDTYSIPTTLVDTYGVEHSVNITYTKVALPGLLPPGVSANFQRWQPSVTIPDASSFSAAYTSGTEAVDLYFDNSGTMQVINGQVPLNVTFTNGSGPFDVDLGFGTAGQRDGLTISGVAKDYQIKDIDTDGKKPGNFDRFEIEPDGYIRIWFDNETSLIAGVIKLANFPNTNGLKEINNNCYLSTQNSGNYQLYFPKQGGVGGFMPGRVEGSTVKSTDVMMDMLVDQGNLTGTYRGIAGIQKMMEALDRMVPS